MIKGLPVQNISSKEHKGETWPADVGYVPMNPCPPQGWINVNGLLICPDHDLTLEDRAEPPSR